jgi:hypothetical protein
MSLTKLSLAGLIIPGQLVVSDNPSGDGKITNLFLQCSIYPTEDLCTWCFVTDTQDQHGLSGGGRGGGGAAL